MPRFPATEAKIDGIEQSIFARLIARIQAHGGVRYPFHIGDTFLLPPPACRLEALAERPPARPYAYSHPFGSDALRDALASKLARENDLSWVTPNHVSFTSGATHALSSLGQVLLSPGDEVLIPAPYWPLIPGIVRSAGASPVEVPFWLEADSGEDLDVAGLLEPHLSAATVAIYLNSPNNPTGRVLSRQALASVVELAQRHDLWLISDEAYEYHHFRDAKHVSLASLDGAAERTVSAFSFSKSYAMAGYRAGYLVGPESLIARVRKVTNHSVYSVAGAVQEASLRALGEGQEWLSEAYDHYRSAAEHVASRLQARFTQPEGAWYVWLELDCDGWEFLERALEAGVCLAPGAAFGHGFDRAMRLCYASCDRETLDAGIEALNRVLAA